MNMVPGVRGVAMMLGPGSKARSAASWNCFESGLSYGEAGSESGGFGVTLNIGRYSF
ncbi:hypothetical protein D3C84_1259470 [compost metagenome]